MWPIWFGSEISSGTDFEILWKFVYFKSLSPLYWATSTVLMFSPHCTDVIPLHVLMLSPYCTEQPPQYWRYPPQYWSCPPHVLMLSPQGTEGIPPQYWIPSTVLMLSPSCTDVIPHCTKQRPQYWSYPPQCWSYPPTVLSNLHSSEAIPHSADAIPPMYWTISTVLNRRYMGWFTFCWMKWMSWISLSREMTVCTKYCYYSTVHSRNFT